MPNQTANYQLNQWEPTDGFLRTDFNEDNAKIDTALADLSTQVSGMGYVVGTYTGTGTYPRVITLGFRPKAVMITTNTGYTNHSGTVFGGLFGTGNPLYTFAEVVSGGFQLNRECTNTNNTTYNYIAFK